MARAVVDASVVVKWFLEEEHGEQALRLRSDFLEGTLQLRVPALLPWEVINALRYSEDFGSRDLRRAAEGLDRAGLVTIPLLGDYLARTIEFALAARITIYDASYLALGAVLSCPVYTSDEALIGRDLSGVDILHIRDYDSPLAP